MSTELTTSEASCPADGEQRADYATDAAEDAEQDDKCEQSPAIPAHRFPTSPERVDGAGILDRDSEQRELETHRRKQTGDKQEREPERECHCEDNTHDERGQERTPDAAGEQVVRKRRELGETACQQPGCHEKHADAEQQRRASQRGCHLSRQGERETDRTSTVVGSRRRC